MGGSQSTVSVTHESIPAHVPLELLSSQGAQALQPFSASLQSHHDATDLTTTTTTTSTNLDNAPSSSGRSSQQRMYKSYRVKQQRTTNDNNNNAGNNTAAGASSTTTTSSSSSVVAVLKVAYLPPPTSADAKAQRDARLRALARELQTIKDTCQQHQLAHVWPAQAWFGPADYQENASSSLDGQDGTTTTTTTPTTTVFYPAHNAPPSPVVWLRPHVYTTLHDRLCNRPWLEDAEKWLLTYQLTRAVQSLHDHGLAHGALCSHNVGLTSTGWLVLLDVLPLGHNNSSQASSSSSQSRPWTLPHDDPTEYWYCFSRHHCLAPERFSSLSGAAASAGSATNNNANNNTLSHSAAAAADVFCLACCWMELHLPTHGGDDCVVDLGQLLDYKATGHMPPALQQKLANISNTAVRAACRHALSLDPKTRLSPGEYWDRIVESSSSSSASDNNSNNQNNNKPPVDLLKDLYQRLHNLQTMETPDTRVLHLYQARHELLYQTMGIPIPPEEKEEEMENTTTTTREENNNNKKQQERSPSPSDLWTETEALLQELESVTLSSSSSTPAAGGGGGGGGSTTTGSQSSLNKTKARKENKTETAQNNNNTTREPRTPLEQSCLLIYVQQILSTMQHVQRPATKLKALRLIATLSQYVSDETRLQRMVPVLVALLKDVDAVVRSTTLHTLTHTLSQLTRFPPSDAQVLPQYIFKRVTPLLTTDANVTVRVALAQTMGRLAETAQRFLDISHAVRLAQAVTEQGSGSGLHPSSGAQTPSLVRAVSGAESDPSSIFAEKVTQLLDSKAPNNKNETDAATGGAANASSQFYKPGTLLVRSSYQAERQGLTETISRWVVHICTDQSEMASLVKRALLSNSLTGLCNFYSLDGVMGFMLPQLLTFLNDRHDWQLRAELFVGLPVVCRVIGRGATEEFVLPCVETALVDKEERVIAQALQCLAQLVEQGLLSRAFILPQNNNPLLSSTTTQQQQPRSILERYSAFLIHPSKGIRRGAVQAFCATCRALGSPDGVVYLTPVLKPFVRFQPSWKHVSSEPELLACLKKPWTRRRFVQQLQHAVSRNQNPPALWTAVGPVAVATHSQGRKSEGPPQDQPVDNGIREDPAMERMQIYLQMLARRTQQVEGPRDSSLGPVGIEGSLKLAQSVVFPRRSSANPLPNWFQTLREEAELRDSSVTESSSIQSVSALGSVYGLSIMGMEGSATESIVGAEGGGGQDALEDLKEEEKASFLESDKSRSLELAFTGDWASEVSLDPEAVDTSLLVTKLNALKVPTLSPNLGGKNGIQVATNHPPAASASALKPRTGGKDTSSSSSAEWKPRMNSMIASSSSIGGHTAPVVRLAVSQDTSFFVSASHDGTCGVWEVPQIERSSGYLERSTVYTGHCIDNVPCRVNDVAMVEDTYSAVSGASNGTVHVWRVDMVSSLPSSGSPTKSTTSPAAAAERRERSRVAGTSSIRQVDPGEGEILAVSHFTSVSNSVVLYATQKGIVRTWDLRSPEEPFHLAHGPKLGHLSALALGGDRNWIITGTSRGFTALWDVRFQQPFKLWRHSRGEKIHRLAASYVPPPQTWGTTNPSSGPRPIVFMGSPSNECSLFDALSGSCVECFRTVPNDHRSIHASEEMPSLVDVSGRSRLRGGVLSVIDEGFVIPRKNFSPSINCMVGSIGGQTNNFLLTGGSDGCLRAWDFSVPSRSYIISGASTAQPRPNYERVDFDGSRRLMMCRQHLPSTSSSSRSYYAHGNQGLRKPDFYHTDSIEDLKILDNSALVSCSRDCTIKVWR